MGDLFLSFNPQTEVIFEFSGNWLAALSVLFILPQGYWLVKGRYEKFFTWIVELFVDQLRPIFGKIVRPGRFLVLLRMFIFIICTNFLGLIPYVFTSSRHLRFTLRLALPLWLGKIILRVIKQLNFNLAHLVPEGTPGPLIPVMVIIETVRLVIRPGTLAVRLAANIVAGHLLLVLLGGQGRSLGGIALVCLTIGLILLATLECAVACIQAYVFTILRSLYLREHRSLRMSKIGE